MKSICIFCGSSDSVHADYFAGTRLMGQTLAERGIRLIYGGGRTGLMGVVADAVLESGGEVVGVMIPSMNTVALAHTSLTQMDVVEGMHARKARMHELADGYIAMPGGFGTFDELFETVTWGQTGAHEKPVGLFNVRDYYAPCWPRLTMPCRKALFSRNIEMFCFVKPIRMCCWTKWLNMNTRMRR